MSDRIETISGPVSVSGEADKMGHRGREVKERDAQMPDVLWDRWVRPSKCMQSREHIFRNAQNRRLFVLRHRAAKRLSLAREELIPSWCTGIPGAPGGKEGD